MERESPESERIVETILVIDIDPSLSLFKPTCKYPPMPARIEMGFQSWTSRITSQGFQNKCQNTSPCTWHLSPGHLLLEEQASHLRYWISSWAFTLVDRPQRSSKCQWSSRGNFSVLQSWLDTDFWATHWHWDANNREEEDEWRERGVYPSSWL